MKNRVRTVVRRWLSVLMAVVMSVSLFPAAVQAESGDEYEVTVTVEQAEDLLVVGDNVTLTAKVTCNGEEVTDLEEAPQPVETPTIPLALENADFENGTTGWVMEAESLEVATDSWMTNNPTSYLNLWASDNDATDLSVSYTIADLGAGSYQAQIDIEGSDSESGLSLCVTDAAGIPLTEKASLTTNGYNIWNTIQTDVFTLTEPTTVIVTVSGTTPAGYWGGLDNLVVLGTGDGQEEEDTSVTGEIEVQKVSTLTDDFTMGMDISTIISEFASGVTYKDFDGNELTNAADFCKFLAEDCGITSVRVRVWNDPYDENGNGYGAGNCNVDTAVKIAEACASAGLTMLVDFHYSDFWADPSRQIAPKAWTNYTVSEKAEAIYDFTLDSLNKISAAGAKITMVQVGNETSNAIAGVSNVKDMCTLFSSGSSAVRKFSADTYGSADAVKVAIHVANPNNGEMTTWAGRLQENNVDYDVLATSYYAFWHGTLSNLKNQMRTVKDTYGKDVMVAETSYVYTTEDTDGKENAVSSESAKGTDHVYESSPQGQATAVRDVIDAASSVGALGVYYWEPAWITVGDITGLEGEELEAQIAKNHEIWETYGSGWASSYAQSYDWASVGAYGGSEWDNQAMFYPDGTPNAALHVWNYVKTGSVSNTLTVSGAENPSLEIYKNEELALPETINVNYSKPSVGTIAEAVEWDAEEAAAVNTGKPGTYTVTGIVSLSQECTDGTTQIEVMCTIIVKEANLITNADAAGFESAEYFTVDGSGISLPSAQDVLEGNSSLHWWSETAASSTVTYNEPISLQAGYYTYEVLTMGYEGDQISILILDTDGNVLFTGEPTVLTGWTNDPNAYQTAGVTFRLEEAADIMFCVKIDISDSGWGSVDAMYLHQHEEISKEENGDGTCDVICADCGALLEASVPGTTNPTDPDDPTAPTNPTDPDDPTDPTNPTDPTRPADPATSDNPTDSNNPPNSNKTVNASNTPKTGDDTSVTLYGLLSVMALLAILASMKKYNK